MAEVNAELMRSRACERSFRFLMWGFLFLLPVPVPLSWQPDVLAWILMVAGLFAVTGLHAEVRRLQVMAAIGLALWFPRFVLPYTGVPRQDGIVLLLYAASWVVVFVFVWRLCGLVTRMALKAGADSLAQGSAWRRWTPLAPLIVLALSPLAGKAELVGGLVAGIALMLSGLVVVLALISLMATTARLCAQLRTEAESVGAQPADELGTPAEQ
jgi:hypothetical protein